MVETYRPLLSEVLKKVHNAKTKKEKVDLLRKYNSESLRMVIKSSFDPKIEWRFPEGDVPFKKNEAPEGTEHTRLEQEARKLFHFLKGGNPKLNQMKCENMFIQMLEGLHGDEAELLIAAKDKSLHQVYKGLSANVVKEAFGWNDNFVKQKS